MDAAELVALGFRCCRMPVVKNRAQMSAPHPKKTKADAPPQTYSGGTDSTKVYLILLSKITISEFKKIRHHDFQI